VLLVVIITLLAGSLSLIVSTVKGFLPPRWDAQRDEVEDQISQVFKFLPLEMDAETERMIVGSIEAGLDIGFEIAQLPTPLPRPVKDFLQALGGWITAPLLRLGGWMGYAFWVLLVAKLLGGRATLSQMLGCTALYVAPQILTILQVIPCLGPILAFVAFVWGLVIYIKATAVANELSPGRALLAAILPAAVLIGLISLAV
ncbi:MAG: hypothetical protein GTO63_08745, partial [Anaerolineae bacterium]|nr:hypothetical protein [Anaerolineae bacterium]